MRNTITRSKCMKSLAFGSLVLGVAGVGACDGAASSDIESTQGAATASLTISGTITGGNGLPVTGVTVQLAGGSQATRTTGATGTFTFSVAPGSFSVRSTLAGCTFSPDVANLSNVAANTVVNFSGSGATCGGTNPNTGAMNGALTISGTISGRGTPLAGAVVRLNGSAQGTRLTTATGTYSFSVNPGSFSVSVSAAGCTFSPEVRNLNNVAANTVVNFNGAGASCGPAPGGAGGSTTGPT